MVSALQNERFVRVGPGTPMGELLRRVAQETPPDLRSLRPAMPAALAELVGRLLARPRAARPADAGAVAAELAALATPEAGTGPPSR